MMVMIEEQVHIVHSRVGVQAAGGLIQEQHTRAGDEGDANVGALGLLVEVVGVAGVVAGD